MGTHMKHLKADGGPYIMAEVAQAHDGSLGMAHAYIDAAADAGVDAVKFQTHIAACESTAREPWRIKFSRQDVTRFDYWKRMEFKPEEWAGLRDHCRDRNVDFISSPFSPEAVDLLDRLDVVFWKIASGEMSNIPLLRKMVKTGREMMLSSGMSSWSELNKAVDMCRAANLGFGVMQCTSEYPCPSQQWGLNVLAELKERYDCPTGLSDHSGSIVPGIAATALGASMLEVHVTFHRAMFGPDVSSSVTMEELASLVKGARQVQQAMQSPVDKDAMAQSMEPMRDIFGKSIVARRDLEAGIRLGEEDLALKKPGDGMSAADWDWVIGMRLTKALAADETLTPGHLQEWEGDADES
jgi:N,N'-diacetyllegionaminate synthase